MKRLLICLAVLGFGLHALAQTLTVYSGRNEEFVAPIIEDFTAQTGTEVEVRYGDTAELAATILEEGQNSPADVFFGQDAGALGALAQAGLFTELPEETLARVEARFRSADGLWVGVTGRARVLAYNTGVYTPEALPTSVFELTDEAYRGRVGWAPANASFQAFVTAMRVLEGEEAARAWLEGMIANEVQTYSNNSSQLEALERGEIDLALVNHYYLYQFLSEQGEDFPVRNHFFSDADLGSLVNLAGVGILGTTDQADEAQQLVDYLLSDAVQQRFTDEIYEYPLVAGIPTNETLLPLAEIETPEIDLSSLDDLEGTLELLTDVGAL
jgi:iron(III) transport system substrate-binding protein